MEVDPCRLPACDSWRPAPEAAEEVTVMEDKDASELMVARERGREALEREHEQGGAIGAGGGAEAGVEAGASVPLRDLPCRSTA